MEIKVAEHSGTCFGVDNAIKIAFEAAKRSQGKNIYIIGELVHNPFVVYELEKAGVRKIDGASMLKEGDSLIIRAHGEVKQVYDYCEKKRIKIIDASCPFVKKAQHLAEQLENEGYKVVLVGDRDHPEVRAIKARTKDALVVSSPLDIEGQTLGKHMRIGMLSQTTQTRKNFRDIVSEIACHARELKIHNTICDATSYRQDSAIRLCDEVELMIVIGGKNSANTKKLYELCSARVKSLWVNEKNELDRKQFSGIERIGITAGASTPKCVIDDVADEIKAFYKF